MFGIKAWFRRLLFVPLAALVLANVPAVCAEKTAVFSVGEKELVAWEKTLSDYEAGTLNTRIPHTVLSEPPPVLARLLADDGCGSDLCIIIHKSILDKTFGKTASKFTGDFHKIALADMRKLPEELANPIAVFDSAHGNGDKVVLTAFKDTETGESVVVAIKINVPSNNAGRVNAVASVHGRQIGSFHKWLKDGLLRYYHTKKFPQWLVSVGVQNPRASIPRGNEILTEKDFRKSAFPAKKRNRKTSKSAFFKNDANVLAISTDAFVCGNSTHSGCRAGDLPVRRVSLRSPYADRFRAVGAWVYFRSERTACRCTSLRVDFRPGGEAFPCASLSAWGEWGNLCPEGVKLVSAGQTQCSPVYSEREFSTLKECNRKEVA